MDNNDLGNGLLLNTDMDLLVKLKYYLNYQISTSLLMLMCYFTSIAILIIAAMVILFTPFMLYALYRNKKKKWLISFGIMVLPLAAAKFAGVGSVAFYIVLGIEACSYYIYCIALRMTVNNWIEEYQSNILLQLDKKREEAKDFDFWYPFRDKK